MAFITRAELDANTHRLLASPKDSVSIKAICVRPNFSQRRPVEEVFLCCREGVVGDRWRRSPWLRLENGEPDPRIQVSLANSRLLRLISKAGQAITLPGDNFVADIDLSEANIPVGQRLRLGEAVIEVSTVYNDACSKFAARYGKDVVAWIRAPQNRHLRLRGIFAQIVQSGRVTLRDKIQKC